MFSPKNNHDELGNKSKSKLSNEQYFLDLEKWLQDAYMWQGVAASFPYFLMCNQYLSQLPLTNDNLQNPILNTTPLQAHIEVQHDRDILRRGIQCKIPAMWKRFLAEFLDFLILFVFKLAVTWIAIDFFNIIDLTKLDLEALQFQFDMTKMNFDGALVMTHNIMLLEIIHRIIVCIFETLWLVRGFTRSVGGATPGKLMMGLRVVYCENVIPLSEDNETVVVYPGTDLDLRCAFSRSLLKNLSIALFIPFAVTFYYFPCNRTSYDVVTNTLVIEEPVIHIRPHQH